MSNENELTVRRIFDTLRERVWEAWTNPGRTRDEPGAGRGVVGPDGFIVRTHEIDVKQGDT